MYKKSIMWFRQDLRVYDNTALFEAVTTSEKVLPIFVLDKNIIPEFEGIDDKKFGFIREALDSLHEQIRAKGGKGLKVFHDYPEKLIPELAKKYEVEKVFANRAYDIYGKNRDEMIADKLTDAGVEFEDFADFLLVEPHEVEVMKVFTPFYKRWQKKLCHSGLDPESHDMILNQVQDDNKCNELEVPNFSQFRIEENHTAGDFIKLEKHPYFTMEFGKDRFENHIKKSYKDERNDLDVDGTSRLSPYHRFGIFSIRQIYNKAVAVSQNSPHPNLLPQGEGRAKQNDAVSLSSVGEGIQGGGLSHFVSELAWREFWHHIKYHFPFTIDTEFLEKRRGIEWSRDKAAFEKWCKGETGYPIVDAAMKQLNETNWMHGRARMVVASFLTKDMHIDWRRGEAYFKKKLLDYDEAVNLGNWQWSASVGADPKPLRIFNPILQSQKFDSDAKFIKKYLPELEDEPLKAIHDPLENELDYREVIVDHRVARDKTKELYYAADPRK